MAIGYYEHMEVSLKRWMCAAILLALGASMGAWLLLQNFSGEAARTASAVAALALVPSETPIVTTVTDPTKLSGTPLAGSAKVGDKVLFYPEAKRAILYDPAQNRIIDMVRLSTDTETSLP